MRLKRMTGALLGLCVATVAHAKDLYCSGTQPFWNISVKGKSALYKDLGQGYETILTVTSESGSAKRGDGTRKYSFKGDRMTADAVVQKQSCQDGVYKTTYPYTVTLTTNTVILSGCCK